MKVEFGVAVVLGTIVATVMPAASQPHHRRPPPPPLARDEDSYQVARACTSLDFLNRLFGRYNEGCVVENNRGYGYERDDRGYRDRGEGLYISGLNGI